jgi:O-acetylserine/cysteine efflux transporter
MWPYNQKWRRADIPALAAVLVGLSLNLLRSGCCAVLIESVHPQGVMTTTPAASSEAPMPARDILFLIAIAAIWGCNAVLTKIALGVVPPLFLSVVRFAITLAVLLPFIKPVGHIWKPMLAVALLTGPLHFGMQFVGLNMAHDLAPMIIAMQLWIPATVVLAAIFLNEKAPLARVLGMVASLVGIGVLVFEPSVWVQMPAFGLVALASVGYAGASIVMRKYGGLDPVQAQAWLAIVTIPTLALASFASESGQIAALFKATPIVWFAIFFAALMSGLVANVGMWRMVQRYEVSRTTPFSLLTPLIAIVLGVVVLGDPVTSQLLIGGLLSLAGVAVVALVRR